MNLTQHRRSAAIVIAALAVALLFGGQVVYGEVTNAYTSPNGYVVFAPTGWKIFNREYTAFRGGKEEDVYVTQETDLFSRTTKYVVISSGSPEAIFGLSTKVISRISKDELVDFYIDQATNGHIDYKVTKATTKGEGDAKVYLIEANYSVPGYRQFSNTSIAFKNGKAFVTSAVYLGTFSNYAPTLQAIADSVTIR